MPEEFVDVVEPVRERPGRSTKALVREVTGREGEIPEDEARPVIDKLLEAQRRGYVVRVPDAGWDLPHRTPLRAGEFHVDRRGRGIVRSPLAGGEDVFVRPADWRGAVPGDHVLVRRVRERRGPKLTEGVVVRVIERTRKPVRGVLRRVKKGWVLLPDDRRFGEAIGIVEGGEDGARDGDPVLVRLVDDGRGRSPRGEVAVHLGEEGTHESDLEVIRAEFELPGPHGPEDEEAAAALPDVPQGASWPGREDLRHLLAFTIDPEDARDYDDAVSLERLDGGRARLGVHIADVSHYAPPDSRLDSTAAARGTSVYLPGHVIPMLPERLANDLCSLRPEVDRLAKSVFITFSDSAEVLGVHVCRSVIQSRRRFTYEEVLSVLEQLEGREPSRPPPADADRYQSTLADMAGLRDRLGARRRERGALFLDIPALRLVLDDEGEVLGLARERHDASHQLIEEFMLAANEAVARHLLERELPLVSRVHPEPEEERLEDFRDLLEGTGFQLHGHGDAPGIQRLLNDIEGSPLAPAIQLALLQTMGHAEYVFGSDLHFALATEPYCHFTSPIRRYPDLLVHQILDDHLDGKLRSGKQRAWWEDRLGRLAELSSKLERRAEAAERAMIQLRLIRHLEPRRGEEFEAWVVSVHGFGFFVRVEELLLEGLVHVATVGTDWYEFDESRRTLRGRRTGVTFRMGDRVRVRLVGLDPDERQVSFELVEGPRKPGRKGARE